MIMESVEEKNNQNTAFKVPLSIRLIGSFHNVESDLSEYTYKFWCKLKGGKFERKNASRPNACILVMKRSSHIFASSVIFLNKLLHPFYGLFTQLKKLFFRPSPKGYDLIVTHLNSIELEVYELSCSEEASFGQGQREYSSVFKKKENCVFCGRCFEVNERDTKIIGNFK